MCKCLFTCSRKNLLPCFFAAILFIAGSTTPLHAANNDPALLSLEELMNTEVSIASKKDERIFDTAAATHVITAEEIRRSGLQSVPELLRLVPGVNVARISGSKWAISMRGFNSTYANKLLILVDGRTVYTPTHAGVNWDEQDLPLADIEHIEVVRGPGATLWGANAVNGIINIVTKEAGRSEGLLVSGSGGSQEYSTGTLRYGGNIGQSGAYRAYANDSDQDGFEDPFGVTTHDAWERSRGGFRVDFTPADKHYTLQGDIYAGTAEQSEYLATSLAAPITINSELDYRGGNILARYQQDFKSAGTTTLQLYYDRAEREETTLEETRESIDLDLSHLFPISDRQQLLVGGNVRQIEDEFVNSYPFSISPDSDSRTQYSLFFQDDIALIEDELRVIIGTKFEHNDFTGDEIQPNLRAAWSPNEDNTLWASVARAVRTPSRVDRDMTVNVLWEDWSAGFPPTLNQLTITGNQTLDSEELLAYELGYRSQLGDDVSIDLALFYNDYDKLIVTEFAGQFDAGTHWQINMNQANGADGYTAGGELQLHWNATDRFHLAANYSHLNMELDEQGFGGQTSDWEKSSPEHQASLCASLDLPGNLEFDSRVFYVSRLPAQGIDAYTRVDARIGWLPSDNLTLSLVGQNLADGSHTEFNDNVGFYSSTYIPRSGYLKADWKF